MGLLALGTPLAWSDAAKHADYVREHGIEQLLHIWERLRDRTGDRLLWGDEVKILPFGLCERGWGRGGEQGGSKEGGRGFGDGSGDGARLRARCAQSRHSDAEPSLVGAAQARAPKSPPTDPPSLAQVEYLVISYDDEGKNARLSLRQTEVLEDLQADAQERRDKGGEASGAGAAGGGGGGGGGSE